MVNENNNDKHGYVVDIRVFLATITVAMAVSFIAGVGLGPVVIEENAMQGTTKIHNLQADSAQYAGSQIDMLTSEEAKKIAEEHLPAGQHLLVDIQGVDADFLNSEDRLSKAMVDTVQEAELTLLSYHCHSLIPSGVSCVGVLLESHISFHTWPDDGVITLDLFTCGSKPLLPAVDTIQRLFGVGDNVHIKWSHELRGFRPDHVKKNNYLDGSSDLSLWVLSPLEMYSKEQIYSNLTKFQRIDIWDIREVTDTPTYDDIVKHNMTPGDPRLSSPEYATPDRLLFLDGTLQSIRSSEVIYHEAMVHPAMFAHPNPQHVAILGGGEGATLREVLKHKTVKSAKMIEIDEELVKVARQLLPEFSDCSDLVGRADNCFDDQLTTLIHEDGRKWFMDRQETSSVIDEDAVASDSEKFDVILLDALDPEEDSSFFDAELLYNDEKFISSLMKSLSNEGVLAIQVGTAATIDDPRADVGIYKNREKLFNLLEENDEVAAMLVYEEPHCGFLEPHSFLIACKNVSCRSRWYARNDLVDYQIYDRIVRTNSKRRALSYYDGTTQHSYQWPKKGWETVYCRRDPTPFECAYITMDFSAEIHEFEVDDEEESSFRVETTKNDDGTEVSRVFATVDIPKGSFIMPSHLASSLEVTSRNLEGLKRNTEVGGGRVAVIEDLLDFFDNYAHESSAEGSETSYVEVGSSCLIRRVPLEQEANVKPWLPPHPSGSRPKYSPVYERHRVSFDVFVVASEDIAAGSEIKMHEKMWKH